MDPFQDAWDVIRCDLCETPVPPMHCHICNLSLCKPSVGEHISDESKEHKVVSFQKRGITPNYPKCSKHFTQCELHCEQCDIPLSVYIAFRRKHIIPMKQLTFLKALNQKWNYYKLLRIKRIKEPYSSQVLPDSIQHSSTKG